MKKLLARLAFIALLIAGLAAAFGGTNKTGTQQPITVTCGQGQVWNGSSCYYP